MPPPPLANPDRHATLTVLDAAGQRTVVVAQVGQRLLVGRDPMADIVISGASTSRIHADITPLGPRTWALRDLGSRFGLFAGGLKVPSIQVGETPTAIQLGRTHIVIRAGAARPTRVGTRVVAPVEDLPSLRRQILATHPQLQVRLDHRALVVSAPPDQMPGWEADMTRLLNAAVGGSRR